MYAVHAIWCALVLTITSSFYSCGVSQGGSSRQVSHSALTVKLSVTPASGGAPLLVNASTAGSSDPNSGGMITNTSIDFGDGTVVNTGNAQHTYNTPGNYTVTATLADNFGMSSKTTGAVSVTTATQPPPPAPITVNLNGTTYTLKDHPRVFFDGAGGVIDTGIKYNRGNAPKAVNTNPPWVGVDSWASTLHTTYPYTNLANFNIYADGSAVATLATHCYSANDTNSCNDAMGLITNFPQYYPLYCDNVNSLPAPGGGECNWQYSTTSYGIIYYLPHWIYAFELMYSRLSSAQRALFADQVLNDISFFGGISGSPSTSCTDPSVPNAVSITVSGNTVTAGSPVFGSGQAIQVGYWVEALGQSAVSIVLSVTDSTHATIATPSLGSWNGYSGQMGYRRNTWIAGDCGAIWVAKFEDSQPKILTYNGTIPLYSQGSGTPGGIYGDDCASNNNHATYYGYMAAWLSLVDDDANAAQRSQANITLLHNYWLTNCLAKVFQAEWTGFQHSGGGNYGRDRPVHASTYNAILVNSINGTPPALGGIWDKSLLYQSAYNWLPSAPAESPMWGQNVNGLGDMNVENVGFLAPTYYEYHNTNEGKRFNWWLQNRNSISGTFGISYDTNPFWVGSGGGFVSSYNAWAFLVYFYTDPTFATIDETQAGTPTALVLNQVDGTGSTYPQSVLISRTGYGSTTDTLLNFYGLAEAGFDHNSPCLFSFGCWYPGDYRIFKGHYLLAPDGQQIGGNFTRLGSYWNNNGAQFSNYVELGGTDNLPIEVPIENGSYLAQMPRGDSDGTSNRFAYAMVDSTNAYKAAANASRVQRQLVDFKGGTQQFIIVYDDVATTIGQMKRTYLHYPNNFGASTDSTKGTTSLSGIQITSSYPGTGHGDATQLLTEVLAPAGAGSVYVYTDNPNGTYTGGNGSTFRVSICASAGGLSCDSSNLAAEFLVVHEPLEGSSNSLPAISLLSTIDTNHRGVQIDGSSAKVAVFARAGQLFNSASFTTSHSGTGQYLIAGLTPGHYSVSASGATVLTNAPVVANDNTLYFESSSGVVSVTWTGP